MISSSSGIPRSTLPTAPLLSKGVAGRDCNLRSCILFFHFFLLTAGHHYATSLYGVLAFVFFFFFVSYSHFFARNRRILFLLGLWKSTLLDMGPGL
jgi:hypothetical protein